MGKFAKEFKKLYREKYESFLAKEKLKERLKALDSELSLLFECVPNQSDQTQSNTMVVGNAANRISITNLGTLPPLKHNSQFVYPMNYTSKRKFRAHRNYQKAMKDKVLYVCSIERSGFSISADDGTKWEGEYFWAKFQEDCECQSGFKSFEEFFGLTHPNVIKAIEGLDGIEDCTGYVLFDKRSEKEVEK